MQFASLGSGSKGNATVVDCGEQLLLIDCGFSTREVRRRLARLGREPAELTAIVVTHEHGDHISGVGSLARSLGIPVYLSSGTRRAARDLAGVDCREINPQRPFEVDRVSVQPVAVPHDAREPCQFVLSYREHRLGVLTDLGSITEHVVDCYGACDALLLECNHDSAMLRDGPYPWPLKQRVGGDWGHLNNGQAAQLLQRLDTARLQQLVVAHVSEKNNTAELAVEAVSPWIESETRLQLADQEQGFDWIALS